MAGEDFLIKVGVDFTSAIASTRRFQQEAEQILSRTAVSQGQSAVAAVAQTSSVAGANSSRELAGIKRSLDTLISQQAQQSSRLIAVLSAPSRQVINQPQPVYATAPPPASVPVVSRPSTPPAPAGVTVQRPALPPPLAGGNLNQAIQRQQVAIQRGAALAEARVNQSEVFASREKALQNEILRAYAAELQDVRQRPPMVRPAALPKPVIPQSPAAPVVVPPPRALPKPVAATPGIAAGLPVAAVVAGTAQRLQAEQEAVQRLLIEAQQRQLVAINSATRAAAQVPTSSSTPIQRGPVGYSPNMIGQGGYSNVPPPIPPSLGIPSAPNFNVSASTEVTRYVDRYLQKTIEASMRGRLPSSGQPIPVQGFPSLLALGPGRTVPSIDPNGPILGRGAEATAYLSGDLVLRGSTETRPLDPFDFDTRLERLRRGVGVPGAEQLVGQSSNVIATSRVPGEQIYFSKDLNQTTIAQVEKFIATVRELANRGLGGDYHGGNILYDPSAGFGVVDYAKTRIPPSSVLTPQGYEIATALKAIRAQRGLPGDVSGYIDEILSDRRMLPGADEFLGLSRQQRADDAFNRRISLRGQLQSTYTRGGLAREDSSVGSIQQPREGKRGESETFTPQSVYMERVKQARELEASFDKIRESLFDRKRKEYNQEGRVSGTLTQATRILNERMALTQGSFVPNAKALPPQGSAVRHWAEGEIFRRSVLPSSGEIFSLGPGATKPPQDDFAAWKRKTEDRLRAEEAARVRAAREAELRQSEFLLPDGRTAVRAQAVIPPRQVYQEPLTRGGPPKTPIEASYRDVTTERQEEVRQRDLIRQQQEAARVRREMEAEARQGVQTPPRQGWFSRFRDFAKSRWSQRGQRGAIDLNAFIPGKGGSSKLDLNLANYEDLLTLPGVGPATAKSIISHREQNGPFRSTQSLGEVKGVTQRLLDGLKGLITITKRGKEFRSPEVQEALRFDPFTPQARMKINLGKDPFGLGDMFGLRKEPPPPVTGAGVMGAVGGWNPATERRARMKELGAGVPYNMRYPVDPSKNYFGDAAQNYIERFLNTSGVPPSSVLRQEIAPTPVSLGPGPRERQQQRFAELDQIRDQRRAIEDQLRNYGLREISRRSVSTQREIDLSAANISLRDKNGVVSAQYAGKKLPFSIERMRDDEGRAYGARLTDLATGGSQEFTGRAYMQRAIVAAKGLVSVEEQILTINKERVAAAKQLRTTASKERPKGQSQDPFVIAAAEERVEAQVFGAQVGSHITATPELSKAQAEARATSRINKERERAAEVQALLDRRRWDLISKADRKALGIGVNGELTPKEFFDSQRARAREFKGDVSNIDSLDQLTPKERHRALGGMAREARLFRQELLGMEIPAGGEGGSEKAGLLGKTRSLTDKLLTRQRETTKQAAAQVEAESRAQAQANPFANLIDRVGKSTYMTSVDQLKAAVNGDLSGLGKKVKEVTTPQARTDAFVALEERIEKLKAEAANIRLNVKTSPGDQKQLTELEAKIAKIHTEAQTSMRGPVAGSSGRGGGGGKGTALVPYDDWDEFNRRAGATGQAREIPTPPRTFKQLNTQLGNVTGELGLLKSLKVDFNTTEGKAKLESLLTEIHELQAEAGSIPIQGRGDPNRGKAASFATKSLKAQSEVEKLLYPETLADDGSGRGNIPPGGGVPGSPGFDHNGQPLGRFGRFRQKLRSNEGAFGFFASGALSTLRYGLPSMVMYGAAQGISNSIREAEAFQFEMSKIKSQLEDTFGAGSSEVFQTFKSNILDIAQETGMQADQIAALALQIQGAFGDKTLGGESGQDLVESQIENIAKISQVTKIPAAELTDGLTAASLAFGMNAKQIGDIAIKLESKTGVLAKETIGFIGDIAPVAQESGFSAEEFAALSAVVQQRSGRSGTALAESFGRIIPAISQNRDQLLGLAAQEDSLRTNDFIQAVSGNDVKGTMIELAKGFDGLSKTSKEFVINLLGGRREAQALIPILANSSSWEEYEKSAEDAAGSLEKRFRSVQETLTNQMQRLGERVRQVTVALMEGGLGDALSAGVAGLSGMLSVLSKIVSAAGTLNEYFFGLPAKILAVVAAFKLVRTGLSALSQSKMLESLISIVSTMVGSRGGNVPQGAALLGFMSGGQITAKAARGASAAQGTALLNFMSAGAMGGHRLTDAAMTASGPTGLRGFGAKLGGAKNIYSTTAAAAAAGGAGDVESSLVGLNAAVAAFTGVSTTMLLAGGGALLAVGGAYLAIKNGLDHHHRQAQEIIKWASDTETSADDIRDLMKAPSSSGGPGTWARIGSFFTQERLLSEQDILESQLYLKNIPTKELEDYGRIDSSAMQKSIRSAYKLQVRPLPKGLKPWQRRGEQIAAEQDAERERNEALAYIHKKGFVYETLRDVKLDPRGFSDPKQVDTLYDEMAKAAGVDRGDLAPSVVKALTGDNTRDDLLAIVKSKEDDVTKEEKEQARHALRESGGKIEFLSGEGQIQARTQTLDTITKNFQSGAIDFNTFVKTYKRAMAKENEVLARTRGSKEGVSDTQLQTHYTNLRNYYNTVSQHLIEQADDLLAISQITDAPSALQSASTKVSTYRALLSSGKIQGDKRRELALSLLKAQQEELLQLAGAADTADEAARILDQGSKIDTDTKVSLVISAVGQMTGSWESFSETFKRITSVSGGAFLGRLQRGLDAGTLSKEQVAEALQHQISVAKGELQVLKNMGKSDPELEALLSALEQIYATFQSTGELPGAESVVKAEAAAARQLNQRRIAAESRLQKARGSDSPVAQALIDLATAQKLRANAEGADKAEIDEADAAVAEAEKALQKAIREKARSTFSREKAVANLNKNSVGAAMVDLKQANADYAAALADAGGDASDPNVIDADARRIDAFGAIRDAQNEKVLNSAKLLKAMGPGGSVEDAQADVNIAKLALNLSVGDDRIDRMVELKEAEKALTKAEQERRKSFIELVKMMQGDDPVKGAQFDVQEAQRVLSEAQNIDEKIEAQKALISAEKALREAMTDVRNSMFELRQAELEAMGDDVGAAQVAANQARAQLTEALSLTAQGKGPGDAEVNRLKAAVVRANKAASEAALNDQKDDAAFMYEMGQMTKTEYVAYLEGLKSTLLPGTAQWKDLERTIKGLKDDIAGGLQMNLPGNLSLPTLYEARRLDQSVTSTGAAVGYQDNRVQNVQVVVTNGMSQAEILNVLNQALGTGTSGRDPRLY